MNRPPHFPGEALSEAGLNRQFLFSIADLPEHIRQTLGDCSEVTQLLLLGHGGRRMWECVQASGTDSEHPIDGYSIATIKDWLAEHLPGRAWRIIYPGEQAIALQGLGKLAGWHHAAPFMVGIDAEWGSWYAYRAVVLLDADFLPSVPVDRAYPCSSCAATPCIGACPAAAMTDGRFDLAACASYRLQSDSSCAESCLARLACPVGREHRYAMTQIAHSYGRSLAMLRQYSTVQTD